MGTGLVVSSVSDAIITFSTDITAGDADAASNCVINRRQCTSCFNGLRDGTETDVDCGGPTCDHRCGIGLHCIYATDCRTGK